MYNILGIGLGNDVVTKLNELSLELERKGFDFNTSKMLRDAADEIDEKRSGLGTHEEIENNLLNSRLKFDELKDVKELIDTMYKEARDWEVDNGYEINYSEEEKIDQLIEWQKLTALELKMELVDLNISIKGLSKSELFEKLARTLY